MLRQILHRIGSVQCSNMELRNHSDTPFWFFKLLLPLSLSLSRPLIYSPSLKMTWLSSFHLLQQMLQSQFGSASYHSLEESLFRVVPHPTLLLQRAPPSTLFSFSFTSPNSFLECGGKKQEDTKMFPSRDIFFFFFASINKEEIFNLVQDRDRATPCSTKKLISTGFCNGPFLIYICLFAA